MATSFIEEAGAAGAPVIVRLADGSEINLFELFKENTSNRGVHDDIAALASIESPAHKDIAYVVDEGAVMAFINGEWVRPGPESYSDEDISALIDVKVLINENFKFYSGFNARLGELRVISNV